MSNIVRVEVKSPKPTQRQTVPFQAVTEMNEQLVGICFNIEQAMFLFQYEEVKSAICIDIPRAQYVKNVIEASLFFNAGVII